MKNTAARVMASATLVGAMALGLAPVAQAAPTAPAGAAPAAQAEQQALTPQSYIKYLQEKAGSDPAAAQNLRLFTSWTPQQQKAAIDKLASPAFQKALVSGSETEMKAQGITSTKVAPAAAKNAAKGTVSTLAATYNVSADYVHQISSMGLLLFSLRQDFRYVTGNGVVLRTTSCQESASQYYPLGHVNGSTSHYLLGGGQARCRTLWTYELNYGIGSIKGSSYQELTVNGPGVVSRVFYDV